MGYVLNSVITSGYLVPFLPKKRKRKLSHQTKKPISKATTEKLHAGEEKKRKLKNIDVNQATQQRARINAHGKTKIPLAKAIMSI